jgi:hypothetical protein
MRPEDAETLCLRARAAIELFIHKYPNANMFEGPENDAEYSFHLKQLMESTPLLRTAMELNPEDMLALRYFAVVLYVARHPSAVETIEPLLRIYPKDIELRGYLARLKRENA